MVLWKGLIAAMVILQPAFKPSKIQFLLSDWKMTKKRKCQLNLTGVLLNSNLVILIRLNWDGRRWSWWPTLQTLHH